VKIFTRRFRGNASCHRYQVRIGVHRTLDVRFRVSGYVFRAFGRDSESASQRARYRRGVRHDLEHDRRPTPHGQEMLDLLAHGRRVAYLPVQHGFQDNDAQLGAIQH
jgi:hypothetical protein